MNIVSSLEMKTMDKRTIEKGTPSIELMKRASTFMLKNIDTTKSTLIICGSGNNGGDGISLAEDLYKINKNMLVVLVGDVKTQEANYYLDRIKDTVKIV